MIQYYQNALRQLLLLLVFASTFLSANAQEVLFVDNLNNSGPGSLRDAVAAAQDDDFVVIDVAGTLQLLTPINITKRVWIQGPMPAHFTIDCSIAGTAFSYNTGYALNLFSAINGIRFIDATNTAVDVQSGRLHVEQCVFDGNVGGLGAAIYNSDTTSVKDCSFMSGTTTTDGGAIYNKGYLYVENSTFYDNATIGSGGAIYSTDVACDLLFCTFYLNDAVDDGGAIHNESGTTSIYGCLFYQNGFSLLSANTNLSLNLGSMSSTGGSFYDSDAVDFAGILTPHITDVTGSSLNPDLATQPVFDGFGMEYFPIMSGNSPAVDIGNANAPSFHDQRRCHRVMQGLNTYAPDAGAIEYTPWIVTNNDGNTTTPTTGSLAWAINGVNSNAQPHSIVFDIQTPSNIIQPTGSYVITNATIIDAYTQHNSLVPGPQDPALFTPTTIAVPGVNLDGSIGINAGPAVYINGANFTDIRGFSIYNYPAAGLVIGGGAIDVNVEGMHLGVDETGISNNTSNRNGIVVTEMANDIEIGNWLHHTRNIISNSDSAGILLEGQSNNIDIYNNFIGTGGYGSNELSNKVGVHVRDSSYGNQIGDSLWLGNLISGNDGPGIWLADTMSDLNVVLGNFIGTDLFGVNPIPNHKGVLITNRSNLNFIGGNLVSGNDSCGIQVDTWANWVAGNVIGADLSTAGDLGNGGDGIYFGDPLGLNVVGGVNPGEGNLIGWNGGHGINLVATNLTVIQGNLIGVASDSVTATPNDGSGIYLDSLCVFVAIGAQVFEGYNLIVNNGEDGITLNNTSGGHTIAGNWIGTVFRNDLLPPMGNAGHGIYINENSFWGTRIGDSLNTGPINFIGYNGGNGITIENDSGNKIYRSPCYANDGLGIDLANDGITGVDTLDFDIGANTLLNAPEITSATACSNGIIVEGHIYSNINRPFRIEFYASDIADPTGYGEGLVYLDFYSDSTDINGYMQFSTFIAIPVEQNWKITATATNEGTNNTSEFSAAKVIDPFAPAPTLSASTTTACINGPDVIFTGVGSGGSIVWADDPIFTQIVDTGATISLPPDTIGIHTLYGAEIVNGQCLSGYDSVVVQIFDLDDPSFTLTDFCVGAGQPATNIASPGGTFDWDIIPSDGATLDVNTGLISNATAGSTYTVTYTTSGPCVNSSTVSVSAFDSPSFTQITVTNEICEGDANGIIDIGVTGGTTPYSFSIDGGVTFQSIQFFTGLAAGTYDVLVEDQIGCTVSTQTTVGIETPNTLDAGPDLITCVGTPITIEAAGFGYFIWYEDGNVIDSVDASTTVNPNISTGYLVSLTTGACTFFDSVFVTVTPSDQCADLIANAFSPDGDGVNDIWVISLINGHPENAVNIFNRWGDEIASFKDYNNTDVAWDAMYNGTKVSAGTYYYTIYLADTEESYTGWVQVTY